MKYIFSLLAILFTVNFSYAQTDVPAPSSTGPLGGGSWLRFITGTNTNIQEGWGLNLMGDNIHPVKINNANFMVGYTTAGQDVGVNNVLINGNVGIGTINPNTKLDVRAGSLAIGNGNLDPNYTSLSFLANSGQMLIGQNRSGGANETDFIANAGVGSNGGFAFYNHDNSNTETQLMWILGNGQVLIGNTQGKQGNYKLAVAGSAIATSMTVKEVSNWPDYIFKPTYKLPSLSAVKTYIDQNQHLPEMPSADEVEKNGINLGEMVKLQAKKIEELTLYLIEKDRQVNDQQKEMNQLKLQLKALAKEIHKD